MKQVLRVQMLITLALLCFNFNSFAQEPQLPEANTEAPKGLVNGKSTYLAKPVYPEEARVNRISGKVQVKILIDESGNVIEAKAQTGDQILHKAAEEAAVKSKFTPTTLQGKPVKVTGIIVFNFTHFEDWERVGAALSMVEAGRGVKSYGIHFSDVNWQGFEAERDEYILLSADESVDGKSKRATKLIKAIEKKLELLNPTELWYFRLGLVTSKLSRSKTAEIADEEAGFLKHLKEVEFLFKSAPSDVPKVRLDVLAKIADYATKSTLTKLERTQIVQMLIESFNQKISTK